MKYIDDRPVFLANVDDEDCTITTISLVDDPAMQLPLYCFSKDQVKFSIQDETRHNIISCIVRTDFPILRITDDGRPFYVVFNRETSEKLCQKLMKDGFAQNISLDHNGELIDGIQLQEVFIKDSARGVDPKGFEDAAEGSLFGVYHITDEDLWKDCLEGRFGGVSMETLYDLKSFKNINKKNNMSKIKEMLKRMLMEFNNLSTDKAELYWEEDTELMVGYKVFVDEGETKVPAPDGEYVSDQNLIKVENGVVTEIAEKEEKVEDETKEEAEEKTVEDLEEKVEGEVPAEEDNATEKTSDPATGESEDKVAELENRISDLEAKVEELMAKIVEISTAPAAAPVIEEFEQVTKTKSTGDKNLDKRIAMAKALRN